MGLFDSALRAVTGAEKEGLEVLRECLDALGKCKFSPEEKRGARKALEAVMVALKKRNVTTPESEKKAERMISLFDEEESP